MPVEIGVDGRIGKKGKMINKMKVSGLKIMI